MKTRVMSVGPPMMIVFPLSWAIDVIPFFAKTEYGTLVVCSITDVIGAPPKIASMIWVEETPATSTEPAVSCCASAADDPV
jgi:hypothetical protein